MGTGRFVRCEKCGNEWIHYTGIGMSVAYWYCDECGKGKREEISPEKDFSNINGSCSCGGSFTVGDTEDEIIICPDCKSKDVSPGNEVFDWD